MDPDEVEFIGEKQLVTIIPTFNSKVINLISGDVGPFRASLPVRVPLWLAINLKQQQKCKIQPPDWMEVERLESIKEDEKSTRTFTKMPSEHYMVEAKLLLGCASDDIPRADEIRTIIKDIWDIRTTKIRSSVIEVIQKDGSYAAVDNLTIMEINSIRPILPHALDQIYRIKALQGICKRLGNFLAGGQNKSIEPNMPYINVAVLRDTACSMLEFYFEISQSVLKYYEDKLEN